MEGNIHIADILANFLQGKAITGEEIEILDQWIEADPSNREFLVSLCQEDHFEQKHRAYQEINADLAFEKMLARRRHSHRKQRRIYALSAVAALMILFLGGNIFLKNFHQKTSLPETTVIVAGSSKALLTLENGKKITLTDTDTLVNLISRDSVVSRQGRLAYAPSSPSIAAVPEYNILETPCGGEYRLALSDGTEIWLNAGSRLKYPVHFSGKYREIELSGEAYFEVSKDTLHPFIVKTSRSEITVLGTHFCISDYQDAPNLTTLVSGSVQVTDLKGNTHIIRPGEQACAAENGLNIQKVETYYFTAWKDGYFIFKETTLNQIMNTLSKWYDFEYFYTNPATENLRLSARLKKYDNINEVLDILSRTGEVHFTLKGRAIIVWDDKR